MCGPPPPQHLLIFRANGVASGSFIGVSGRLNRLYDIVNIFFVSNTAVVGGTGLIILDSVDRNLAGPVLAAGRPITMSESPDMGFNTQTGTAFSIPLRYRLDGLGRYIKVLNNTSAAFTGQVIITLEEVNPDWADRADQQPFGA